MARAHGRVLTAIWDDPDFLALPQAQQRLYMFLLSQSNLNHAGLLPVTLKRWSKKAPDLSIGGVEDHLEALAAARFVVLDDDTEELLIRTLVRNDGVYKMPKVMAAMVSGAQAISSRKLRRALLVEMDRLPLEELSDEPGPKGGPSVRAQVIGHIEALRKSFGNLLPDPPDTRRHTPAEPLSEGIPGSAPEGHGNGSDTPGEGFPEGYPEGYGEPSTRAHTRTSHARTPAPAPAPAPAPSPVSEVPEVTHQRAHDDEDHSPPSPWQPSPTARDTAAADITRLGPTAVQHATNKFLTHRRLQNRAPTDADWVAWLAREHATTTPPSSLPVADSLAAIEARMAAEDADTPRLRAVPNPVAPPTELLADIRTQMRQRRDPA